MEQRRRHSAVHLLSDDKSSIYVLQLVTIQYTDLASLYPSSTVHFSRFAQGETNKNHETIPGSYVLHVLLV